MQPKFKDQRKSNPRGAERGDKRASQGKKSSFAQSRKRAAKAQHSRTQIGTARSQRQSPFQNWPQPEDFLYEDNHVLALAKPAGLAVQGGPQIDIHATERLQAYIKKRDQKPGAVWLHPMHRLDQPVSGVLIFAHTSKAASRIQQAFAKRVVSKYYVAVVGVEKRWQDFFDSTTSRRPEWQHFEDVLSWHSQQGKKRRYTREKAQTPNCELSPCPKEGRELAHLSWLCLKYDAKRALAFLLIRLGSGKQHQIRAQLSAHGLPILGDRRYAPEPYSQMGKSPCLHAWRYVLPHPTKKEPLQLTCPLPHQSEWTSWVGYLPDEASLAAYLEDLLSASPGEDELE